MAQFQLSVSKTYTVDTDDWEQPARDNFSAKLAEVGFDGKGQPSTKQCEEAMRKLIEADDSDDFWDAHIDLDEITPADVKIVNFSRQFEKFGTKEEKKPDVKTPPSGQPHVATKPQGPATSPAPKIDTARSGPIQGARDSKQNK
jgi:hypothetical protein